MSWGRIALGGHFSKLRGESGELKVFKVLGIFNSNFEVVLDVLKVQIKKKLLRVLKKQLRFKTL